MELLGGMVWCNAVTAHFFVSNLIAHRSALFSMGCLSQCLISSQQGILYRVKLYAFRGQPNLVVPIMLG
ncbi:MAG: hypothetical protein ACI9NY_000266 [Kiritimatiellia bacterium]|jgi:hypothetical protein